MKIRDEMLKEAQDATLGYDAPAFTVDDLARIDWSTGEMSKDDFFQVGHQTSDPFAPPLEKGGKANKHTKSWISGW